MLEGAGLCDALLSRLLRTGSGLSASEVARAKVVVEELARMGLGEQELAAMGRRALEGSGKRFLSLLTMGEEELAAAGRTVKRLSAAGLDMAAVAKSSGSTKAFLVMDEDQLRNAEAVIRRMEKLGFDPKVHPSIPFPPPWLLLCCCCALP